MIDDSQLAALQHAGWRLLTLGHQRRLKQSAQEAVGQIVPRATNFEDHNSHTLSNFDGPFKCKTIRRRRYEVCVLGNVRSADLRRTYCCVKIGLMQVSLTWSYGQPSAADAEWTVTTQRSQADICKPKPQGFSSAPTTIQYNTVLYSTFRECGSTRTFTPKAPPSQKEYCCVSPAVFTDI
jgi:hypothetical protein